LYTECGAIQELAKSLILKVCVLAVLKGEFDLGLKLAERSSLIFEERKK